METSNDSTPPVLKKLPANAYVRGAIVVAIVSGLGFLFMWLGADATLPFTPAAESPAYLLSIPSTILFFTILWSFLLNWVVALPAIYLETEKFFDLTGSITFITCTIFSVVAGSSPLSSLSSWSSNPRAIIQSVFVLLWALRLGTFLFSRIKDHKDGRFDDIKINPPRFFAVWTIQGLWVALTALPVFVVNSYAQASPSDVQALDCVGYLIWALGFFIEVVSDRQKAAFAKDPANKGKYIECGLWYYSRHPNYFGESTLWLGQFIASIRTLSGAQYATVFSPVFVLFLLTKVSGVPGLESRADKKWGGQIDYEIYKLNTSVFVPWFKGSKTQTDQNKALLNSKA